MTGIREAAVRTGMRVTVAVAGLALAALMAAPGHAAGAASAPAVPPKVKDSTTPAAAPALPGRFDGVLPRGRVGFCGGDDWEPEIAADHAGHVYLVWAHYPGNPSCDPASANPNRVYIRVSSDQGKTFGPAHEVIDKPAGLDYPRQVDCVVTVDPVTGAVYVSFLAYGLHGNQTDVIVAKSNDFGQTFTAAKVNGPTCINCDHPWTAADGADVYVAYAHNAEHFLALSTDGGSTWTEHLLQVSAAVAFPEGAVLDAQGNAWFA